MFQDWITADLSTSCGGKYHPARLTLDLCMGHLIFIDDIQGLILLSSIALKNYEVIILKEFDRLATNEVLPPNVPHNLHKLPTLLHVVWHIR